MLETLKAVLKEADMAIMEIRKDALDFQREILIGGENSRNGKIEAERIIKYRKEKDKKKQAQIDKLNTKKKTLNTQIDKIKAQLLKKQELGDDLKFIDFHQLQIENKKYLIETREKGDKMIELKLETGKIVKMWNERKILLKKELDNKRDLLKNRRDIKRMIKETNKDIDHYTTLFNTLERKLEDLKSKVTGKNNETQEMNVESFIEEKLEEKRLNKELKNYIRKIDIAKLSYRKAVAGLKRMGQEIEVGDEFVEGDSEFLVEE